MEFVDGSHPGHPLQFCGGTESDDDFLLILFAGLDLDLLTDHVPAEGALVVQIFAFGIDLVDIVAGDETLHILIGEQGQSSLVQDHEHWLGGYHLVLLLVDRSLRQHLCQISLLQVAPLLEVQIMSR